MDEKTDEEIAKSVQQGDDESFGFLIDRYENKLTRYAKRFLPVCTNIGDLVQDVFIKAYTNIQGFNPGLRFSSWIYRIAHNTFINVIRKRKRERIIFIELDTLFPHPTAIESTDALANEKELKEKLNKNLTELEFKYREPLILRFFEEMSYEEIADILHMPISTVGVRIARGKLKLKKIYEKHKS